VSEIRDDKRVQSKPFDFKLRCCILLIGLAFKGTAFAFGLERSCIRKKKGVHRGKCA
jgi:hypothetical protein